MKHLVLGSILALLATIADAAVYLNPPNITYAEGQTAYLRCSVTGISSPSFKWHHWGYPRHQQYYLFGSGNKRYSSATDIYWNKLHVRESGSESLLIITDLKIFNSGIYTCVVGNQPAHATLKVERKSNITLTVPSRVSASRPITVRCSTMAAIPVETLSWHLDGVLLNEGVTSQTYINRFTKDPMQ
ncbi:obscurin-like [Diadema antillarum]|uniref:obscurin-like n=1 Tax=Diadema antillarum TaxID=105358 RepID=UPI003A8BA59D